VAVMPSVGRRKQVLVAGLTAAVLGVVAPSASADNEVWLWACQGPTGSPLTFDAAHPPAGFQQNASGGTVTLGSPACSTPITGALTPGENGVAAGSKAGVVWSAPSNTQISSVQVSRATHGFSAPQASDNQVYTLATGAGPLETLSRTTAQGDATAPLATNIANPPTTGDFVRFGVSCESTSACGASGVSFDVSRVGMRLTESTTDDGGKPHVAVGGTRTPVGGITDKTKLPNPDIPDPARYLNLHIQATDGGVGLYYAQAYFDGQPVQTQYFAEDTGCKDLTPGTASVDLAYGSTCPTVDSADMTVDAGVLPNGFHTLIVRVVDAAGHVKEITQDTEVLNNVDRGSASQSLSIGTNGINTTPGSTNNNGGSGGVAGASSQNCNTPRLSVVLADKPKKVSKGVPVLVAKKRYKFTGRLTCVINGKRKAAPKRARIDLQNKIGKKTYDKSGTTVASKGNFTIILAYRSSRTLIFRFTNADGKRSQVSIKIKVQKAKKSKKKKH
jgi:hypothetical protein